MKLPFNLSLKKEGGYFTATPKEVNVCARNKKIS